MSDHVMLDLETFSTKPTAFILSIGATKFDPLGEGVKDSFSVGIELDEIHPVILKQFHIDPGTVNWWMKPDQADARLELQSLPKTDLASALDGFVIWFGDKELPVWGNGAAFDNVVLRYAFETLGLSPPWGYRQDRCFRTLKNLMPHIPPIDYGTAHDAVSDAIAQALHMQAIVKALGLTVIG